MATGAPNARGKQRAIRARSGATFCFSSTNTHYLTEYNVSSITCASAMSAGEISR